MTCPICSRLIICKVFLGNSINIHCVCGYNWPGYSPTATKIVDEDTHEFYGDWEDEEVCSVLKGIECYCDNDLRFFKGKKIVTTWQDKQSKVLVYNNVTELVKAIK